MPSLHKLQHDFANALFGADDDAPVFAIKPPAQVADRIAIYRRTVFANYRNALAATYPVVKRLVGAPFFNTAVDSYVRAHPSASGDLNVYGDAFADFLAAYPHAANLPYLPDVARLEWAIDEANRAPDFAHAPDSVLAALSVAPPDELPSMRLRLEPSCRLITSDFPILRIWQVNQRDYEGECAVAFDQGGDTLLVRRGSSGISLERVEPGEYGWLAALAAGAALGTALEAGQSADASFDFAVALRTHVAAGTIAAVVADDADDAVPVSD
jgi:hypothetical protein